MGSNDLVNSTGQSEKISFSIDKSQCGQRLDIIFIGATILISYLK
jgi:hypothetical protein